MDNKLYHECYEHVCQARTLLEDLQRWGFTAVPKAAESSEEVVGRATDAALPVNRQNELDELKAEVEQCRRCALAPSRSTTVFARGNPAAELVFVGEAPGYEEDWQGLPFVGEAGALLDRIIMAMGLSVDEVYICNLIKCRPPENRNPDAEEVAACRPYLEKQLLLLKPKVIVTLGRFAAQSLLGVELSISRLRGNWYTYQGVAVMPTFHPAYLLRQPAEKKNVWTDMKKVMVRLGAGK